MKKWVIFSIILVILIFIILLFVLFQKPVEEYNSEPKTENNKKENIVSEEEKFYNGAKKVYNTTISGIFDESQIWSGEILITGDTTIKKDLTILPGTIVKFVVGDSEQQGNEIAADGYNDLDPTRLSNYTKTHSALTILGKLTAKGSPENKILFTSASENKKIADWEALNPFGDGSIVENSIIEYSRNGLSPGDKPMPNSIFRKNVIRYTFWGAISSGHSSSQIYENEIYECGHEGIDVQGGQPKIENNLIYDCHTGIVVLNGNPTIKNNIIKNVGDGIHIEKSASPILQNNSIELAPSNLKKEWIYGNFAYQIFGEAKIY